MDYLQLMPAVWRLRFPKDTERDFIQHYEETNIRTVKISLAFGFVLYSSFGILDIFSAPNSTSTAWFYRFGIGSPTLLLIVIITHIKALRSHLQQIISGGCIVAAITVSLIIKETDPSELAHTHYYVGLIIIMMFTGSWARLKFWYAFVSNTLIISIYFVVLVTDGHSIHNRLLIINNGVMLLSAHCVSALTCYFFEVNSRIDFLQRRTIEAEKNKSNAQREELELQAEQLADALNSLETTQAQLVQREKMASLGELTAGIAHEIQNPLNFVNNFAEVSTELAAELQAEAAQPQPDLLTLREAAEDLRQNQERIRQHGRRAANIVRDMLAHARANSGARVLTDLNALADEHLHLAYHSLRAKDPRFNAALTTHFDPALGAVEAIPEALSRVMVNLFNNAFYAVRQRQKTEANGYRPEVQVYTHRSNERVEVRVRDNGPGIPAPIRDKIFQPFFTTKPSGEGTGLGLSLSYDIITQGHGGKLTVDSQEGEFTEFTISLPQSQVLEKAPQTQV